MPSVRLVANECILPLVGSTELPVRRRARFPTESSDAGTRMVSATPKIQIHLLGKITWLL